MSTGCSQKIDPKSRFACQTARGLLVWLSGFCFCSRLSDYDFGREKLSSVCARQPDKRDSYKQRAKSAAVLISKNSVTTFETPAVHLLPRFELPCVQFHSQNVFTDKDAITPIIFIVQKGVRVVTFRGFTMISISPFHPSQIQPFKFQDIYTEK